jgi:hypothetical protein
MARNTSAFKHEAPEFGKRRTSHNARAFTPFVEHWLRADPRERGNPFRFNALGLKERRSFFRSRDRSLQRPRVCPCLYRFFSRLSQRG